MDLFNLTQVVTDCTHTSPNGNSSLIDFVLILSPLQSVSCTTIPPLANCDHDGLRLKISHKGSTQCSNTKKRTIWQYAHADFSKANHLISQTDWDSLYCEDIDQHSTQWQDMYMSIMEQKFFHPNAVTDHGSTSPYPSAYKGKMQHSKELKIPTHQGYGCTTSIFRTE